MRLHAIALSCLILAQVPAFAAPSQVQLYVSWDVKILGVTDRPTLDGDREVPLLTVDLNKALAEELGKRLPVWQFLPAAQAVAKPTTFRVSVRAASSWTIAEVYADITVEGGCMSAPADIGRVVLFPPGELLPTGKSNEQVFDEVLRRFNRAFLGPDKFAANRDVLLRTVPVADGFLGNSADNRASGLPLPWERVSGYRFSTFSTRCTRGPGPLFILESDGINDPFVDPRTKGKFLAGTHRRLRELDGAMKDWVPAWLPGLTPIAVYVNQLVSTNPAP